MLVLQLIPDRMNRNITSQDEESERVKIPTHGKLDLVDE